MLINLITVRTKACAGLQRQGWWNVCSEGDE